jgi:O-antigen chain-terminating methyltransferase
MKDNTIEIRDDEINVEEIMARIKENVRMRHLAGKLHPFSVTQDTSILNSTESEDISLQEDLVFINSNSNISNTSYVISSHHRHIGKFLVKGRELVNGEVRRYVDPVFSQQSLFNGGTARILNRVSQKCAELDQNSVEMKRSFSSELAGLDRQLADAEKVFSSEQEKLEQQITELEKVFSSEQERLEHEIRRYIESSKDTIITVANARIKELFFLLDDDIHQRISIIHALEKRMQSELSRKETPGGSISSPHGNYFLFEERFRGSWEEIKKRQESFLPYFEGCTQVLDIGCGRGEFLEILREHRIFGIGVDVDADMVNSCLSRQLDVHQSDAIAFLETIEDESLDGIFMDQVVEHLEPGYLIRILALCYQKLKSGYYIVIETVNPLSFFSFVNFYIDMTHKRPVHPETLQYILMAAGFRESVKEFFSPVSDENKLKKIPYAPGMGEDMRIIIEVQNHNIGIQNSILFGYQDYAVIGKK